MNDYPGNRPDHWSNLMSWDDFMRYGAYEALEYPDAAMDLAPSYVSSVMGGVVTRCEADPLTSGLKRLQQLYDRLKQTASVDVFC